MSTDRSSRPHGSPSRLATAVEDEVEMLRRQRLGGPAIARRIMGTSLRAWRAR